MNKGILSCVVAVLAFCSVATGAARADESAKAKSPTSAKQEASEDLGTKQILMDATRVSTDKVVKGATKEKVKGKEATSEEPVANDSDEPAVTELRRLPPEKATKDKKTDEPGQEKKAKGGPLKNIHGTVYGGTGANGRDTGGAVGASTRGGKTAIYVEAEQNRGTAVRH